MKVLGLTGSIGMGKSTAAQVFKTQGVPVHDADATVHELMEHDGAAYQAICDSFPGVANKRGIDRQRLGDIVFAKPAALRQLEKILHPLVRKSKERFLSVASRRRQKLVVLDVPLLFETGGDRACYAVCVVTAPKFVQKARVLRRPGMTLEKFDQIVNKQMADAEKRRRADFIIQTGLGRLESLRTIRHIVQVIGSGKPNPSSPRFRRV